MSTVTWPRNGPPATGSACAPTTRVTLLPQASVLTAQAGSVLVKGSRFMRMERVVQALQALDPSQQRDKKDNAHAA